jgi:hypothetical protein
MNKLTTLLSLALLLAGCAKSGPEQQRQQQAARPKVLRAPPLPARPAPRPAPTIDPRSSEAAEQLVRSFARLLQGRRFDEAYMLLGPGATRRRDFTAAFEEFSALSVRSGLAGDQEGAAGSIYVNVPLTLSGKLNGRPATRRASAVLRRVNDVPGSTEAQRRWHIERIEWDDVGSFVGKAR